MTRALVFILLTASCGGDDDSSSDAAPSDAAARPDAAIAVDAATDASLDPMSLAETGLYSDFDREILAPGVVEYDVNYELWADGAAKRRFVFLPEGAAIDTSDMDFWRLPAGTKLWKEFTQGGVRVETRLIWKQSDSDEDWYTMSYGWTADRSEAPAKPYGVEDALGTLHDIPSSTDCKVCHERQPGFALGFSALQLDREDGDMTTAALAAADRLSIPPGKREAPIFPLPGGEVARAALGYLHGNCGPCHNENSDLFRDRTQIVWHLDTGSLDEVEETTIYRTTVDQPPKIPIVGGVFTAVIEPGDTDASVAYFRMTRRDPREADQRWMPPLASEAVDEQGGLAALGEWIETLSLVP